MTNLNEKKARREFGALDAEIAAEEKAAAPVEELEEYDVCTAIHTKTLAQRVRERCQMEAGELPPFTPETMPECDSDLIDDINQALEEIDASNVNAISELAACFENDGRKAKAAGYRQVAQLAALYAVDDAIEAQPELEELLSELFDWSNPAQLPENIAAGVADALTMAREVFNLSLLSPDDLSECTRLGMVSDWSMENKFFRGMDDDFVSAFCVKPACGVWISFFNDLWVFERDGVANTTVGAFCSEHDAFVKTLSRYLGPDAEDLY